MKYKKSEYQDNLATFGIFGSTKTLHKLEKVYGSLKSFVLKDLYKIRPLKKEGRSPYDPELLFKMLYIQHMYGLSDRDLIDMLEDRISFRKFLNIQHSDDIPDRAVLIRFRKEYFKKNKPQKVFNQLLKHLQKNGLVVKAGSIIDSTIVESPGKRSSQKRDRTAKYFKKNNVRYFGYKMHINADRDTKIIKKVIVTTANKHDSECFDDLLSKRTTKEVYADKGYASPVEESILEDQGIESNLMRKSYRGRPLSKYDEQRNNRISKTRSRVEHIFGRIRNEFRLHKTKYFTKYKNSMSLIMIVLLYNVKEGLRLGVNF